MLNMRGNDIAHCPVVMAYALVSLDGASLFVDLAKVPAQVEEEIKVRGSVFYAVFARPNLLSMVVLGTNKPEEN